MTIFNRRFSNSCRKTKNITKSTYLVLQDFDDYIDNIADTLEDGENPLEMMIVQICLMIYKMDLEEFLDLLRMKVSIRFYQK